MKLYDIIQSLRTTSGNNDKQAILDANKDNELLKQYFKAMLDPAINYYQTKLPKVTSAKPSGREFGLEESDLSCLQNMLGERRVTGKDAVAWLKNLLECRDVECQELIGYILKRQIPDAKVGETMVLKTWPGLFFIPPYMRCKSMDAKIKEHYSKLPYFYVQTKRDGSFAYLLNSPTKGAKVITRQGSFYPTWFAEMMTKGIPEGDVLVGEMEVYEFPVGSDDIEPTLLDRKTGNGVLNSILQGADETEFENYEFRYVAWDMLTIDEFKSGKSSRKYEDRFSEFLIDIGIWGFENISVVDNWKVTSVAEANAIHLRLTKEGKEGTVWKDPAGFWRDSSSGTKDQVKNKVVFDCDMEITGYYEGTGKAAGKLGGFNTVSSDRKVVNDVGSGFSDKQREDFWKRIQEDPNAFIGDIVALEANDVIDSKSKDTYSLSLPIFIEVRTDKKEADSYERIMEQLRAAQGK